MWPFWRFLESMNVLGKMGRSQEKERKKERKKTNSKHKMFGTR
jgi:hypothetical protein